MALISYQFGSKLDLWKTIIADVGEQIGKQLAGMAQQAAHKDAGTALRDSMIAFLDFACVDPRTARFLLRDAGYAPDRAQWVFDKITRVLLDHFLPLMENAKQVGQLRTAYPEIAFMHFAYGTAVSIVRRELLVRLAPQAADDGEFRAMLHDTLIDPVFHNG